jgi:outer membrane protein assembly factor BamB
MGRSAIWFLLVSAVPLWAADSGSGEWPQWRGPDRTGLSSDTGLLQKWPEAGPKLAWKITGLGEGYSTPSISGGKIYLLGTKGNDEYLICLTGKDGTKAWDIKIGSKAGGYPGPRSTPTIDNGFAYAVSSDGNLVCVAIDKGTLKWKKNFKSDFNGRSGQWAYTESPLVDGDWVIATPGADDAALVAFNKANGEVVWKTVIKGLQAKAGGKKGGPPKSYATAGYSSAIIATLGGVKQYVQFISGGVVGVEAKTGKLLWHYDDPANGSANIATPIVRDDFVFAASAYSTGGGLAKVSKDGAAFKAEQQYFEKQIQNHHGGLVLVKDHVYGTNARNLLCLDFKTGKIVWDDPCVGKGSVTYADGHLYVRGENGKVALVEANPAKYIEKARFTQPERSRQSAWPHPVVVGGKLYLRDWDALFVYDVK